MAKWPQCIYRSRASLCLHQTLNPRSALAKWLGTVSYGCRCPDRASFEERLFMRKLVKDCVGYKPAIRKERAK